MLLNMDWRRKLPEDWKNMSKYGHLPPEMQESMLITSSISIKKELKKDVIKKIKKVNSKEYKLFSSLDIFLTQEQIRTSIKNLLLF